MRHTICTAGTADARPRRAAVAALALLATLACALALTLPQAQAAEKISGSSSYIPAYEYADGEAIEGYLESMASMGFDAVENTGDGFASISDMNAYYYTGVPTSIYDRTAAAKTRSGFGLETDGTAEVQGTLRYTGGTYTDADGAEHGVYALLTVTIPADAYQLPEGADDFSGYVSLFSDGTVKPGVYVNTQYVSTDENGDARYDNAAQLMNFYCVGIGYFEVEIQFYDADSDEVLSIEGHMTAEDIDSAQALRVQDLTSAPNAIEQVAIHEDALDTSTDLDGNGTLGAALKVTLLEHGEKIASTNKTLDVDSSNEYYKYGLVELLFTTSEDEPIRLRFDSTWLSGYTLGNSGGTGVTSFFSLTPETITLHTSGPDDPEDVPIEKTVDKDEAEPGDELTYTIDAQVHERGVTCNLQFAYGSLCITDTLPDGVTCASYELVRVEADGTETTLVSKRAVSATGVSSIGSLSATSGVVEFAFAESYLENTMLMEGEHYVLYLYCAIDDDVAVGTTLENSATFTWDDTTVGPATATTTVVGFGDLTISKTVENAPEEGEAESFSFSVTLKDSSGTALEGSYAYTTSGGETGTIASGGTISLGDGETATIADLPAGTVYRVKETDAGEAYLKSSNGSSGTVRANKTSTAAFVNTYSGPGINIVKTVGAESYEVGDEIEWSVTVTNISDSAYGGLYVYVSDTLPEGLSVSADDIAVTCYLEDSLNDWAEVHTLPASCVSVSDDGGTWTVDASDYYMVSTNVTAGYFLTVTFTTTATAAVAGTTVANTAEAWATDDDVDRVSATAETYVEQQYGSLAVSKTVTGGTDATENAQFTFKLTTDGEAGPFGYTTTDGESGTVSSGGSFVLTAGQTATIEGIPAGTTCTVEETGLPSGFSCTAPTSQLRTAAIEADSTTRVSFTNTYAASGSWDPGEGVEKLIDGSTEGLEDYTFDFVLTDEEGATVATGTSNADGSITFSQVTYSHSASASDIGTHSYTLSEVDPGDSLFSYDASKVQVEVEVSDNGDGTLSTQATYDDAAGFTFNNISQVWTDMPITGKAGALGGLGAALAAVLAGRTMLSRRTRRARLRRSVL